MHYLNGSGTPFNLNSHDMDNMLSQSANARKVYDAELVEAEAYASQLVNKPDGDYDIDSRKTSLGEFWPQDNIDWFIAIGRYVAWGKGVVHIKKNCTPTLDFKFEFRKRYQWQVNLGKYTTIPIPLIHPKITDEQMGEFNEAGMAKEFDIIGEKTTVPLPMPPAQSPIPFSVP